jgi:hypothetical protein
LFDLIIINFDYQALTGITASDINILDTKSPGYLALVDTVKSCLVTDGSIGSFNVTVMSVKDTARRLNSKSLRGKKNVQAAGVAIDFSVSFDVDKQQFLDVDDGLNSMKNNFNSNAASGVFDTTLKANVPVGSPLTAATGSSSAVVGTAEVKTVLLLYPTMQPTISCRPTVTPTQLPTTTKPTTKPTTIMPTPLPTTASPTFIPTFRTSKLSHLFYIKE